MIGLLALILFVASLVAGGIGLYGVMDNNISIPIGGEIFLIGAVCAVAAVLLGLIGRKISSKLFSYVALIGGFIVLIACLALFFIYDGMEFFQRNQWSFQDQVGIIWDKFKCIFDQDGIQQYLKKWMGDVVGEMLP